MTNRSQILPLLLVLMSFPSTASAQDPAPELVVSVGHSGAPQHAAFVGRYLATAARSNVEIIDLANGRTVAHLPQGSLVLAMQASPASDLLAVGSCGHAIQLWNVNTRTLVRRFALTQECAETLSFSPDGAFLATGADGGRSGKGLQIWDVRTGNLARELGGASDIRRVVFSGDGRWVAGVDERGKASVFEWPSGRALRTFEGLDHSGSADSAVISSRDGRYLAWLGNGLRVWDVTSGNEVPLPGARRVDVSDLPPGGTERQWSEQLVLATVIEFLDDGRLAYVDDDRMIVRELPDGPQQVISLPEPKTTFIGDVGISKQQSWLNISRDGFMLGGSSESRTVVWDVGAARLRELVAPALMSPTSLQWSSNGVVVWADLDSGVQGWDDRLGKPADFGKKIDSPTSLALRPDGARVAVANSSSIYILDVAKRRAVASLKLPPSPATGVAFSPDGSRLAFASSQGFSTFDGNLRSQVRIAALDAYTDVEHAAFSPDGRWIAAGLSGPHPTLRVWPGVGSGSPITLDIGNVTYGPQPPAFSGDSRWLASFKRGSTLTIWSTASWNVERAWTLPGTGRALAFAPVGARLAVASDGEGAIWDANTVHKLVTFSVPGSAELTEVAWSPDALRVVTSADDGVLRFWSSSDGRLLASLYMLESDGDWLLVTPDGRLDGSERALTRLVAWRVGDRVVSDSALTGAHRVPRLWRSISTPVGR
jgi:WD40 repeat protein